LHVSVFFGRPKKKDKTKLMLTIFWGICPWIFRPKKINGLKKNPFNFFGAFFLGFSDQKK